MAMNSKGLQQIIIVALVAGLAACGGGGGGSPQDPLVDSFHIAYVKRPFPLRETELPNDIIQPDVRDPLLFYPKSDLYIRDHASAQAPPRNITLAATGGEGDVKDVDVSYDGKKLLFALKKPDIEGRQPEEQPTWNIWEYNIETDTLRKIIEQDIFSEEGQDIAPAYLPDGRIIFSSSRQYGSKETLTNEAKPRYTSLVDQEQQHAMMLHVMNDDGTDIRQITFAPVIDMDPYVRGDGKVIFTRWDRFSGSDAVNIYSINPDGTDLQLLYGAHSHDTRPNGSTIQYSQVREYPDGRVLTILRPFTDSFAGGDIVLIDTDKFADYGKPTKDNPGLAGTGQVSLTGEGASASETPTLGGRYISVFPLWDGSNRSLVSWTPCRMLENDLPVPCTEAGLANSDVVEAVPIYNLYIYDHAQQTKLPIFLPETGKAVTDVVAAQPRTYPVDLDDTVESSTEKTGILHIRSVYDFDGGFNSRGADVTMTGPENPIREFLQKTEPDDRNARFLRLIKNFVRPDRDHFSIPNLANRGGDLVEIIGYAPIEPDGSVKVRVPANVPFSFQIVDKDGRRIDERRHMSWLQVRKGETLECNGCHDHNSDTPHGRRDAITSINTGADQSGIFPGQGGSLLAKYGETMAETRTRISCENENCKGLNPTVNIVYKDVWSIIPSAEFNYSFNFSDDISDPVSKSCVTNWTKECRVVINYVTHIDPLWEKERITTNGKMVTCSQNGCHSPVAKDGVSAQVPAPKARSQLNLDNLSTLDIDDDTDRLEAYTELFSGDILQDDTDGILVDVTEPQLVLDDNGDPIPDGMGGFQTVDVPVSISGNYVPIMRSGAANSSRRFFNIFTNIDDPDHYDPGADGGNGQATLSPAELKLISEWLDIGAQYYNDPFAVPPN